MYAQNASTFPMLSSNESFAECTLAGDGTVLPPDAGLLALLEIPTGDAGASLNITSVTAPEFQDTDARFYDRIRTQKHALRWTSEFLRLDGSRIPLTIVGTLAAGATELRCFLFARTFTAPSCSMIGWWLSQQDDNRRAISNHLHDTTSQTLAALSMNLSMLGTEAPGPRGQQLLAECNMLVSESLTDIRALAYSLHPPLLEELGLESALRSFLQAYEKLTTVHTVLDVQAHFKRLPHDVESALFGIIHERLSFLRRKGDPAECRISLQQTPETVLITIGDDAVVPHAGEGEADREHTLVLLAIQERARQVCGDVTVETHSHGTSIRAIIARS